MLSFTLWRLERALRSRDSAVQTRAANRLRALNDVRFVSFLIALMESDQHPDFVREAAAEALGRIGDGTAVASLARAATRWCNGPDRKALDAIRQVLTRGAESSIAPCLSLLGPADQLSKGRGAEADQPSAAEPQWGYGVRAVAVEVLAQSGSPRAAAALASLLLDRDFGPRAARALQKLDWKPETCEQQIVFALCLGKPETAAELGPEAIPHLHRLLTTSLKARAAVALGFLKDFDVFETLLEMAASRNPETQAAQALAALQHPETARRLAELLVTRPWVAPALQALGPGAVDSLLLLLHHPAKHVRRSAVELLEQAGWRPATGAERALVALIGGDYQAVVAEGAAAGSCLVECLEEWDEAPVRAVKSLAALDDPARTELLIQALQRRDRDIRNALFDALRELGDSRGLRAILAYDARLVKSDPWTQRVIEDRAYGRHVESLWEVMSSEGRLLSLTRDAERWVVQTLAGFGAPAVPVLVEALAHRDARIRVRAAGALEKLGWKPATPRERAHRAVLEGRFSDAVAECGDALEPLLAALRNSDPQQRTLAADALANLRHPESLEPLLAAMADEAPSVRSAAARALGALGDRRATARLGKALRDPEHPVRLDSAKALQSLGDPIAAGYFAQCLCERDDTLEWVAVRALEELGVACEPALVAALPGLPPAARGKVLLAASKWPGGASQMLVEAMNDPDWGVREVAAGALQAKEWSPPDPRSRVLLLLLRGRVKEAAAEGEPALAPLLEGLVQSESRHRAWSAAALGLLGDRRALDALTRALGDEASPVREAALEALLGLGPAGLPAILCAASAETGQPLWGAKKFLVEGTRRAPAEAAALLPEVGVPARLALIGAFGEVQDPAAVSALLEARRDPDERVRLAAVAGLGMHRDDRAVSALLEILQRALPGCAPVIEALGHQGDPRAVPALVPFAAHPDPDVRARAARALGAMRAPEALEAVLSVARDLVAGVRLAAVEALVGHDDPRALAATIAGLRDSDRAVRLAAVAALRRRGDVAAGPPLLQSYETERHGYDRQMMLETLLGLGTPEGLQIVTQQLREMSEVREVWEKDGEWDRQGEGRMESEIRSAAGCVERAAPNLSREDLARLAQFPNLSRTVRIISSSGNPMEDSYREHGATETSESVSSAPIRDAAQKELSRRE